MGMKMDKAQGCRDRMDARLNKTIEEIGKLMDTSDEVMARIDAVGRETERNPRNITKKLDALIAFVNRPASAPR
jgi:hypothetical protein